MRSARGRPACSRLLPICGGCIADYGSITSGRPFTQSLDERRCLRIGDESSSRQTQPTRPAHSSRFRRRTRRFWRTSATGCTCTSASSRSFEGGSFRLADGALDFEKLERYVLARLASWPRTRQKLTRTPLVRRPVWVDDRRFRPEEHIRRETLRGGRRRGCAEGAGRAMSFRGRSTGRGRCGRRRSSTGSTMARSLSSSRRTTRRSTASRAWTSSARC